MSTETSTSVVDAPAESHVESVVPKEVFVPTSTQQELESAVPTEGVETSQEKDNALATEYSPTKEVEKPESAPVDSNEMKQGDDDAYQFLYCKLILFNTFVQISSRKIPRARMRPRILPRILLIPRQACLEHRRKMQMIPRSSG